MYSGSLNDGNSWSIQTGTALHFQCLAVLAKQYRGTVSLMPKVLKNAATRAEITDL